MNKKVQNCKQNKSKQQKKSKKKPSPTKVPRPTPKPLLSRAVPQTPDGPSEQQQLAKSE